MKIFSFILLFLISTVGNSQSYSNSWIDYNKTYYKFKVAEDGVCRISQSVLNGLGLGNIPAEQFQLWRNGDQEIIYTSKVSGVFGASDYIEFWGKMNDGKMDTKLYRSADFQLSDHYSLQTDSAAYYLTVNPSGNNLRFINSPNEVAGTTLVPEPYFMNKRAYYFNQVLSPGYASVAGGIYVYSSAYDVGEGWASQDLYPNRPVVYQFDNINLYAGGAPASFKFAMAGVAYNGRNVKVKFNANYLVDEAMPYFTYLKKEVSNIPTSSFLSNDWARFSFESVSNNSDDRCVVSHVELTYPSKWNFNNKTDFYFELPSSPSGNFLVIDNFNNGNVSPVLLDISSNKRYEGDISSTPGKVKFVLPPSTQSVRQFRLVSEAVSNIKNILTLQKRNFINFSTPANQGDYLIISNPILFNATSGANNVELYQQYRASAEGGGYNAKIIDIYELEDQFGYGINKHPRAIKDFIQFASNTFTVKPKNVFLIGRGVTYDEYRKNISSAYEEKLNLVPTFGYPASDISLASPYGSLIPSVPIGRLSVISGDEIAPYLQKVKEYEMAQKSTEQTIENKLWMKNVVQIIGGKTTGESNLFRTYMYDYRNILEDTLYGAHVELFSKTSNSSVQLINSKRIENLFSEGISILSYFGHSSANTLEYNLSDPALYNNQGRYPFFMVSGCTAGNNFIFDTTRIIINHKSISENFVLADQRGSIAFLASTHFGIPPYLDDYNSHFYNQLSKKNYGGTVGEFIVSTIESLDGDNPNLYYYARTDLEEMALHGDPALRINPHPLPDYVIEEPLIKINPAFISVSEEQFVVEAKAHNMGKAVSDSITIEARRTYPNGSTEIIFSKRILGTFYADSIRILVPIMSTRDKGLNKITITIDANNETEEISEANNSFTKEFYIYEDEARPAYPDEYAIVNDVNQKLYVSTANPIGTAAEIVLEIDTTILFNSSLKVSRTSTSSGGVIEFDPGISYVNNIVYYWRVAVKPTSGLPEDYHWNHSSFIYLSNSSLGSNQSHYYQHLDSDTQNIKLDASREWTYAAIKNELYANMQVYRAGTTSSQSKVDINGTRITGGVCGGFPGIVFTVINPASLKPWKNVSGASGLYGSVPVCDPNRVSNFQFNNLGDPTSRKKVMDFMDLIPDNYIVFTRFVASPDSATNIYANVWANDTTLYGPGNSMYHRLKDQGLYTIDSFYRPRTFIMIYQKDNPEFETEFKFSDGIYDNINATKEYITPDSLGIITSPKFGPSIQWKEMHWRGTSIEGNSPDAPTIQVLGVDSAGNSTTLFNLNISQQDVDISSINAAQYPYIQLRMRNLDSISFTPHQLSYWRLNYVPAPEGALTPEIYFTSKDTLNQGESLEFGIAFKNISLTNFDSLKVKLVIIDNNNVTHILPVVMQKALVSGDTIKFTYNIDTKLYSGTNTIFVEFNPDNDQPEIAHFNNFLYKNFYVRYDNFNPLLDVTFDGVHILNRDIVSARPNILIKLKDENTSLALTDTSLFKVQIRYPDGTLVDYKFDNDTMRFTPADLSTGENTATINLSPVLSGNDGLYELIVSGKDVIGNKAGQLDYHIDFKVISKPMISNLLNYPNPFTTSTAFVFTVTGSVVPQNIRIQILTITGKVIREITKEELGPLHIGRNITEFKWDGSDMYGQKVANGVYLYRVLTNLDGKSLEKFKDEGDNTDKYFTKGYGKMYFMR